MTQAYDFDAPIERRGTRSIKWSLDEKTGVWHDPPAPLGQAPHEAELLPMWLADMDLAAAPPILEALRNRIDHGVFGYTGLDDEFYDSINDWAQRRHGWSIDHDWVTTNTGVMPAINLLIQTFTESDDGVLVQSPVFHPISQAIEYNGRTLLDNALVYDGTRYNMDLDDLATKASLASTKMMVLCSPHNPVGRVWQPQELRAVADICAANDILLISDEIHGDLTYAWSNFVSIGSLIEHHDRLVVCTSPSKAFNLPGLKLSLTIIPDARIRDAYLLTLRNQNEIFGANLLGTTALTAAYQHGEPWLEALIDHLAGNVKYVHEFLVSRLPHLRLVRPDALYLLWIDCRGLKKSDAELDAQLRKAGVWLQRGSTYGAAGEGFLRMTVATPRKMVEVAMERMARGLAT